LWSFYVPCVIMVILYYKIFKAIHNRAKKAIGSRKTYSSSTSDTAKSAQVIENIAQTKRFREEIQAAADANKLSINNKIKAKLPLITETDAVTNTGSGGSHDEEDEDEDKDEIQLEMIECHVIRNKRAQASDTEIIGKQTKHNKTVVQLQSPLEVEVTIGPNGNTDSGYAPSYAPNNIEELNPFCLENPNIDSPTDKTTAVTTNKTDAVVLVVHNVQTINKNGSIATAQVSTSSSSPNAGHNHHHHNKHSDSVSHSGHSGSTTGSTGATHNTHRPAKKKSRFNLGRKHKSTRKKREKASAKRERKATKTLAIVLGLTTTSTSCTHSSLLPIFLSIISYFHANLQLNNRFI
jgi:hypothetical protein